MKIKKCFSLVELLLSLTFIGVMAVGFLPILTKRAAQKGYSTDCLGGFREVKKAFYYTGADQEFTVPATIAGDLTISMLSGGSGGADGTILLQELVSDVNFCQMDRDYHGPTVFYTNALLSVVTEGKSADCAHNSAGASGDFLSNYRIPAGRCRYTYDMDMAKRNIITPDTQQCRGAANINLPAFSGGRSGESNPKDSQTVLKGGVPSINIPVGNSRAGIGESCSWDAANKKFVKGDSATSEACLLSYKMASAGAGGATGALAKFSLSLAQGSSCTIRIGRGGESGTNGQPTVVITGGHTYTTADRTSLPDESVYIPSQAGGRSLAEGTISGGNGGSISQIRSSIGGKGGCESALLSSSCSNPNGEDGTLGSGGGGGSCNDNGCGVGGRGGDGIVVIEYKEQCR